MGRCDNGNGSAAQETDLRRDVRYVVVGVRFAILGQAISAFFLRGGLPP
ncbi:MAG TPA: hypothetical protein PKA37_14630 [Planctomycetota bacterium]|nr:hypothetical protein [Planctomycetota bacterium]